jgi:hypothetical protein
MLRWGLQHQLGPLAHQPVSVELLQRPPTQTVKQRASQNQPLCIGERGVIAEELKLLVYGGEPLQ